MAVAWKVGAWATSSWVGMGGGPPNAWRGATTPVPTSDDDNGLGNTNWLKTKAPKKKRAVRRSDYVHQQEYEEAVKAAMALAAASVPVASITDDGTGDEELEDDELLLMALTRILH